MKIKKPMLSWQPWVMPYWRLSFQLYKAVFKENLCNWNLFAAVMHNIFMIRFKSSPNQPYLAPPLVPFNRNNSCIVQEHQRQYERQPSGAGDSSYEK